VGVEVVRVRSGAATLAAAAPAAESRMLMLARLTALPAAPTASRRTTLTNTLPFGCAMPCAVWFDDLSLFCTAHLCGDRCTVR
jgi:hypothetical protein